MTRLRTTSEQFPIPEGYTKIAQRFNVGTPIQSARVPKGRLKTTGTSVVPSGLNHLRTLIPTFKRWAIFACPYGTTKFIRMVIHSFVQILTALDRHSDVVTQSCFTALLTL